MNGPLRIKNGLSGPLRLRALGTFKVRSIRGLSHPEIKEMPSVKTFLFIECKNRALTKHNVLLLVSLTGQAKQTDLLVVKLQDI